MDLGLKGKVALVTGVGSAIGYGREIARVLAEEGATIIACSRNPKGVDDCVEQLKAMGAEVMGIAFDVTSAEACTAAVADAVAKYGTIDILINNAGASKYQHRKFIDMAIEDVEFDMTVNTCGQMNMARAVLPVMLEKKTGNIVNFAGGRGIPGLSCYGASKGAVIEWSFALAKEVGREGIQVNVFGPGLSRTGLVEGQSEEFLNRVAAGTPRGYLCTPEDAAPIVAFMCSPKNSYMTGIQIDMQMH